MGFEIEEITKTIKKNPVPWAIGLGAAVIGGYIVFRRNSGGGDGYITLAYPETPVNPEDIAAGPGKPGDVSDAQLQELLAQLEQSRHEDLNILAEQQQSFLQGLASIMDKYVSQTPHVEPQPPIQPVQQPDLELQHKIETIQATPTITFHPQGSSYTPQQVDVMYNWAVEENAAISRGYAGTSKNPVGLAASGMTVTYYPTGHVAFTPKGQEPPPTPSSYANTPLGRALAEARSRSEKIVSLAGSEKAAESTLKSIYAPGGHISYFGSEEAYGKAIVEKVKSGSKFSDPQAAKTFVTLHPELGVKAEQIK